MILVFDKMWYVVSSSSKNLAYLTHYEENAAFKKRKETGISWASGYKKDRVEPKTFDNTPMTCFKIVDSVSRWSTSNKLIRVEDPRGFVCEISTGNLVNILKTTVVDCGVIKHPCVWGRDGGVNVLLPVNSEPYQEAIKNVKIAAKTLVKMSEVNVGDTIEFKSKYSPGEYVYLGKGKRHFDVTIVEDAYDSWYNRTNNSRTVRTVKKSDDKPVFIFMVKYKKNSYKADFEFYKSAPKITDVIAGTSEDISELRTKIIDSPCHLDYYTVVDQLGRRETVEKSVIKSVDWK